MKILVKSFMLSVMICVVAACGDNSRRYLLNDPSPARKLRTSAKFVQVEKMNLPDYFSGSEIILQNEQGVLRTSKDDFWADAPDRAFTELLAGALDDRLSADVASSPWPFEMPADIKVEVKVRRLIAANTGMVEFRGQYFLSSPMGGTLAQARRFEYSAPIAADDGTPAMAAMTSAYTNVLTQLANTIAKDVSRVGGGML